jgi:hypothetical protein
MYCIMRSKDSQPNPVLDSAAPGQGAAGSRRRQKGRGGQWEDHDPARSSSTNGVCGGGAADKRGSEQTSMVRRFPGAGHQN